MIIIPVTVKIMRTRNRVEIVNIPVREKPLPKSAINQVGKILDGFP